MWNDFEVMYQYSSFDYRMYPRIYYSVSCYWQSTILKVCENWYWILISVRTHWSYQTGFLFRDRRQVFLLLLGKFKWILFPLKASERMYVVRCAIWNHLYNLKNVKSTHGGVLQLVKLQVQAKACKFTKSYISPWVFFKFIKLYIRYQFVVLAGRRVRLHVHTPAYAQVDLGERKFIRENLPHTTRLKLRWFWRKTYFELFVFFCG